MLSTEEKKNLLYRRQFLLASQEIKDFQHWKRVEIHKEFFLHVHPDLVYNEIKKDERYIILLGDIFDPMSPDKGNMDLLKILAETRSIQELTASVYTFAGRYAIIAILDDNIYLFNDPSTSRKVFYTNNLRINWCASQPHVIAKYCSLEKSTRPEVVHYYNSEEFSRGLHINIGDNTMYDSVRQLRPNHYLDVKKGKSFRFWPTKAIKRITLEEGTEKASEIITGIVTSFSKRYKLMLPVTGGNDSRVLLAACKGIVDDVYLYINRHSRMSDDHIDMRVSQNMLRKLGLKSNVNIYTGDVDEDFKEIYDQNTASPVKANMGIIYNVYYKQFSDYVNLPGSFSDITRNFFSTYRKNITPERLLQQYVGVQKYPGSPDYFLENFKQWRDEIENIVREYNYQILDLFNWEERHGNWATAFQTDKDIAQEDFMSYNNRFFMDVCLGVNTKYRDLDTNILYRSMVKKMWPELLIEPMSPKSWKRYYLKKANLYWLIRRMMKDF